MNLFSDVAIAFGLYLLALFISKFWERPIVWVLESFIFPELKKAFVSIKNPEFWQGLDKSLIKNPMASLSEVLEGEKSNLGLESANDLVWKFAKKQILKDFDLDKFREHIGQEERS